MSNLATRLTAALAAAMLAAPLAVAEEHGEENDDSPVYRAQLTTDVEDREPVDDLGTEVDTSHERVTLFTELRSLEGETVMHRWQYDGETRAEISFEVDGPRWRVWSNKGMPAEQTGDWVVLITSNNGEVIDRFEFELVEADTDEYEDDEDEDEEEGENGY